MAHTDRLGVEHSSHIKIPGRQMSQKKAEGSMTGTRLLSTWVWLRTHGRLQTTLTHLGSYSHGLYTGWVTAQADMKTCTSKKVFSTARCIGCQRWSDLCHLRGRSNVGTLHIGHCASCRVQSTVQAPSELWTKGRAYILPLKKKNCMKASGGQALL
jgi:hypothetical protein